MTNENQEKMKLEPITESDANAFFETLGESLKRQYSQAQRVGIWDKAKHYPRGVWLRVITECCMKYEWLPKPNDFLRDMENEYKLAYGKKKKEGDYRCENCHDTGHLYDYSKVKLSIVDEFFCKECNLIPVKERNSRAELLAMFKAKREGKTPEQRLAIMMDIYRREKAGEVFPDSLFA